MRRLPRALAPANMVVSLGRREWRELLVAETYSRLRELAPLHARASDVMLMPWLYEQFKAMVTAIARQEGASVDFGVLGVLQGSVSVMGGIIMTDAQSSARVWALSKRLRAKGALRTPGLEGATIVPTGQVDPDTAGVATPQGDVMEERTFVLALHAARFVQMRRRPAARDESAAETATALTGVRWNAKHRRDADQMLAALRPFRSKLSRWLPGVTNSDLE